MIAMSTVERRVYLILKAFLKGVFDDIHKQNDKVLKLTTYHIKTLLFWLYEQNKGEQKKNMVCSEANKLRVGFSSEKN
jgi:hypothetical protein